MSADGFLVLYAASGQGVDGELRHELSQGACDRDQQQAAGQGALMAHLCDVGGNRGDLPTGRDALQES